MLHLSPINNQVGALEDPHNLPTNKTATAIPANRPQCMFEVQRSRFITPGVYTNSNWTSASSQIHFNSQVNDQSGNPNQLEASGHSWNYQTMLMAPEGFYSSGSANKEHLFCPPTSQSANFDELNKRRSKESNSDLQYDHEPIYANLTPLRQESRPVTTQSGTDGAGSNVSSTTSANFPTSTRTTDYTYHSSYFSSYPNPSTNAYHFSAPRNLHGYITQSLLTPTYSSPLVVNSAFQNTGATISKAQQADLLDQLVSTTSYQPTPMELGEFNNLSAFNSDNWFSNNLAASTNSTSYQQQIPLILGNSKANSSWSLNSLESNKSHHLSNGQSYLPHGGNNNRQQLIRTASQGEPPAAKSEQMKTSSTTGSASKKMFICYICSKAYARPSTLRMHMRIHSGVRPYHCRICNKSFCQTANLSAHLRTHNGDKPFACPMCHRKFSQSSSVKTHMRVHTGQRPYKCQSCSKTFSDSSTLAKHRRTHNGDRPYMCTICYLRFTQSGNLNRHMRIHRGQAATSSSAVKTEST